MGNETNSIHQQSTTPTLTQCKTYLAALDHLPQANHSRQRSEPFGSDIKKSLGIKISDSCKCERSKAFVKSTGKVEGGKLVRSLNTNSSPSILSKDSSSIVVIERLAKNCKLIPPSPLQSVEYARAATRGWTKRRASGERGRGIDVSEYSPSDPQRSQPSAKSIFNDFLLFTNDDMGIVDICPHSSRSADRFSFGDTSNYPKYPSFLDNDGRRVSELSSSGTPFNISLPRSDVHRASDSVAISWPQGAPPEESVMHCRKCLTCAIYNGNEKGLLQPEYKQQGQRVDYTSKLFANSELLGVLSVGKPYSSARTQKLPKQKSTNPKASSRKVVNAD